MGLSLGINLTCYKTCSFDCVYCQLGKTTVKTIERKAYIPLEGILHELSTWLAANPAEAKELNYITLSGAGEPTLNVNLAELIAGIQKTTSVPVAVITNSSLFADEKVRRALLSVSLVIPSLDAASQAVFERIDRPVGNIKVEDIIEGLTAFRKEFKGKIWLEVMIIKGINDTLEHARKMKEAVERIKPDKVQLNSPVRATAEEKIMPIEKNRLEKIREIIGGNCEVI